MIIRPNFVRLSLGAFSLVAGITLFAAAGSAVEARHPRVTPPPVGNNTVTCTVYNILGKCRPRRCDTAGKNVVFAAGVCTRNPRDHR